MYMSRTVDVAALPGYAQLLQNDGHIVNIYIIDGFEMKQQRIKASQFIDAQLNQSSKVEVDFDEGSLHLSDIYDSSKHYGGFLFVPKVAGDYCSICREPCGVDTAHCEGVGGQSYEKMSEFVGCNALYYYFCSFRRS